jgi:hypothetical protein
MVIPHSIVSLGPKASIRMEGVDHKSVEVLSSQLGPNWAGTKLHIFSWYHIEGWKAGPSWV